MASPSGGIFSGLLVQVHAYLSSLVRIFSQIGDVFELTVGTEDSGDLSFKLAEAEWFGAHDSFVLTRGKIYKAPSGKEDAKVPITAKCPEPKEPASI